MMEPQLPIPACKNVFEIIFKWHHLNPIFMIKCLNLINLCASSDIEIEPKEGFINLEEQSSLWIKGKTKKQIEDKIGLLRINHADYLADIIENTPIENGFWHTDEIPGFSWHNWGTALSFKVSPINNQTLITLYDHLKNLDMIYHSLGHIDQGLYRIQMEPYTVENTYGLKHVNDYFKGKNNK